MFKRNTQRWINNGLLQTWRGHTNHWITPAHEEIKPSIKSKTQSEYNSQYYLRITKQKRKDKKNNAST